MHSKAQQLQKLGPQVNTEDAPHHTMACKLHVSTHVNGQLIQMKKELTSNSYQKRRDSPKVTSTYQKQPDIHTKTRHTPYAGIILFRCKGTISACSCLQYSCDKEQAPLVPLNQKSLIFITKVNKTYIQSLFKSFNEFMNRMSSSPQIETTPPLQKLLSNICLSNPLSLTSSNT